MNRIIAFFVAIVLIAGCQQHRTTGVDPDRILHMAGEEAGQINAPKERLTRQLNIANRQTENGHAGDARKTLAEARSTIEHADRNALTDHERLAGWISLCELARNADDKAFANAALDQALVALDGLMPAQARCEYVLGIEREVKILRGDAAAARLVSSAAEWAMELPQQPTRRLAYIAFADALFHCNDYDAACTVLRRDPDAAWRSDALTALSDRARWEAPSSFGWSGGGHAVMYAAKSAAPTAEASQLELESASGAVKPADSFGKPLDFKSNFYRAK